MSTTPRKHLFLIDLIRLISMVAIITFHSTEFVFYTDHILIKDQTILYQILHPFARLIPYSGHYIIFLSFFLIGFTKKIYKQLFRWLLLFLSAHVLVLLAFHEGSLKNFSFEWDIYPFLMTSFLAIHGLRNRGEKFLLGVAVASLMTLIVPIGNLNFSIDSPFMRMILVGICGEKNVGSWPLIPWLSLPLFAYSLGFLSRSFEAKLKKMTISEGILWGVLLISASYGYITYHLPVLADFPIGNGFYCFILRRSSPEFWSSFFPALFLVRLSLLDTFSNRLESSKWSQVIADLSWNKNFVLTYIIQLSLLFLGSHFDEVFLKFPLTFDLFILLLFVGSEFLGRSVFRLRQIWF